MNETSNLILFPTLKKNLEKLKHETFDAMQQEEYETALENIKYLMSHQYSSYEIHVSKLICLIKLHQLTEAEQFCEDLLATLEDPHYYDYLEYYIMVLYENNKFPFIIEVIDSEENRASIPNDFKKKFGDIYRLAYQMNTVRSDELVHELKTAVKEDNHREQWYILNKWKKLKTDPPEYFFNLLKNGQVHPAIKTSVLEIFIDNNIDTSIEFEKFGECYNVQLKKMYNVTEHPVYLNTLEQLQKVEQDNPTLFMQVKELLYQYSYIRYPNYYPNSEIEHIANALVSIGSDNLSLPQGDLITDSKMKDYKEEIRLCSELLLNISLD